MATTKKEVKIENAKGDDFWGNFFKVSDMLDVLDVVDDVVEKGKVSIFMKRGFMWSQSWNCYIPVDDWENSIYKSSN